MAFFHFRYLFEICLLKIVSPKEEILLIALFLLERIYTVSYLSGQKTGENILASGTKIAILKKSTLDVLILFMENALRLNFQ